MKLSVKGIAFAMGVLFGGSILFVGLVALYKPGYGHFVLRTADSIYPWYDNHTTVPSVLNGTLHGLIDGAVFGALFAWLNNKAMEWF